jgi:MFS family permease
MTQTVFDGTLPANRARFLDMTGYQWTVIFAAWLGWGFDVFDSLLFNLVAPSCVPTLLGLEIGSDAAKSATLHWTGVLTSILLIGWGIGGIVFGKVADAIGRTRTLLLTMLLYSVGTAACAFAPNLETLIFFRAIASLGIGGEWAAGAAMVAEVVPEKRRVEAGALLYTSAPLGLMLATYVTKHISGEIFPGQPEVAWRYVFACGLAPALIAFLVRLFIKEPERWKHAVEHSNPPRIAELFAPKYLKATLGALAMAVIALLSWWSSNAFLPTVAGGIASAQAAAQGLEKSAATAFTESFKAHSATIFNMGGLIGTLLTIPLAKHLGRRAMFGAYLAIAAVSMFVAFRFEWDLSMRAWLYGPIGFATFGALSSFTYYLPELYPTRLRGTGAGFTYNFGRFITAAGPFLVGSIAARGANATQSALQVLVWVALVPALGLLMLPFVVETRGRVLED